MPIDYSKYPKNWKMEIRPAILERAENCCEFCGVENGNFGFRDDDGVFHRWAGAACPEEAFNQIDKCFTIVLTVAHLNHDITDNRPENLRALCQKCHLNYDREQHARTRKQNKIKQQEVEEKMYKCPKCGWIGELSETRGNAQCRGGCPVCWVKRGRYIPTVKVKTVPEPDMPADLNDWGV
ncbi:MAG: hypothetical protein JXR78_01795 [Victivallales bacterium]|nr:hypothetical protein [Victivallales bacterium]